MSGYCVISINCDGHEVFHDLVLAASGDDAALIVEHLRPDVTTVAALEGDRLRELAERTDELTEEEFADWLSTLGADTNFAPSGASEPLRLNRWVTGAAVYPAVVAGNYADELLQAVVGDLRNSGVVETINRIVFEASDGNYYCVTVEPFLERADRQFVEQSLLTGKYDNNGQVESANT